MNPNDLPQKRPMSASIAQNELDRRPRTARADHVVLKKRADGSDATVIVDGEELHIPHFAGVSCGLASDRSIPTVTITIHAKRVQITTRASTSKEKTSDPPTRSRYADLVGPRAAALARSPGRRPHHRLHHRLAARGGDLDGPDHARRAYPSRGVSHRPE